MGPAGTKTAGRWANCSAPISRPGTILSHTPRNSAASNTLCDKRHGGGQRNHVAREQRQFHAGCALGDAVAHRGHGAGDLGRCAHAARGGLDRFRVMFVRLVRRQHVVVGGDDAHMGGTLLAHLPACRWRASAAKVCAMLAQPMPARWLRPLPRWDCTLASQAWRVIWLRWTMRCVTRTTLGFMGGFVWGDRRRMTGRRQRRVKGERAVRWPMTRPRPAPPRGGLLAHLVERGLGLVPEVHADVGGDHGVNLGQLVAHARGLGR
jgi:hypothetical protein